jgi:hypothetical protein
LLSIAEYFLNLVERFLGDDFGDCPFGSHLVELLDEYSLGFFLTILSVV